MKQWIGNFIVGAALALCFYGCASTGNNDVETETENNGSVIGDINILNGDKE